MYRYHTVEMKLNDKILLTFTDVILDKNNLNTFTRSLQNHEYIFEDSKLIIKN